MLLNRLTDRYKRWRHGHGYGVHSPYAYHIVREVLRPSDQVGYYAYTDIHSLCRRCAGAMSVAEAMLLYRILVELHPAKVAVAAGAKAEIIERIVVMALPHSALTSAAEADLWIVDGNESLEPDGKDRAVYFTHSSNPLQPLLWEKMPSGQLYINPTRALLVPRPCTAKQSIAIKF